MSLFLLHFSNTSLFYVIFLLSGCVAPTPAPQYKVCTCFSFWGLEWNLLCYSLKLWLFFILKICFCTTVRQINMRSLSCSNLLLVFFFFRGKNWSSSLWLCRQTRRCKPWWVTPRRFSLFSISEFLNERLWSTCTKSKGLDKDSCRRGLAWFAAMPFFFLRRWIQIAKPWQRLSFSSSLDYSN